MNWTQQDVDDLHRRRQFPNAEKIAPSKPKSKSHGTHTPGQMNKTETSFSQYLDLLVRAKQIDRYFFEQITLRLGHDCRFTADFAAILPDGTLSFYEVKARRKGKFFSEDDSKVKIKVAASMFPFRFFWVCPKSNGEWEEIEVARL